MRKRPEPAQSDDDSDGITVLYEDNHLLVVVKPQNIPTQADSSGDVDLLTMLKQYLIKKYNKPGDAFLGLVHRLDRPTGGIMVFAKTSKAASRLSEQIRDSEGEFEKTYAAVAVGRLNRKGRVEHYLVKDVQANTVTVAPSSLEGAKKAVSEIDTIDEKNGLSLVRIKLLTGRTHQARVQLKALGAPIVGDYRYAGDKLVKSPHLALWAYKLTFAHPISGDKLKFIAAPPDEFPWTEFDTAPLVDIVRPQDSGHYFK
ncbi:MAG: RluA family pseudouridine synthase [Clostridiales bacterium]|nr:RluA family pseudouridine synthase [Clostridiales bacterium]